MTSGGTVIHSPGAETAGAGSGAGPLYTGQGEGQGVGLQGRGWQRRQQCSADLLRLGHDATALLACSDVASDDEPGIPVERPGSILHQEKRRGMMLRSHGAISASAPRKRAMASRRRDLTVPSGNPSSPAISE